MSESRHPDKGPDGKQHFVRYRYCKLNKVNLEETFKYLNFKTHKEFVPFKSESFAILLLNNFSLTSMHI